MTGRFALRSLHWRQAASPQALVLLVGVALTAAVHVQDSQVPGDTLVPLAAFVFCWLPFAITSAKRRHLDSDDARKIQWTLAGQFAWTVLFVFVLAFVLVARDLGWLVFAGTAESRAFVSALFQSLFLGAVATLLVSLAFSVLYRGDLDPLLVVKRTWVVGGTGLLLGAVFVLLERLAIYYFSERIGLSQGTSTTAVCVLTAAVAIPMRRLVDRFVGRLLDRWSTPYALADGARRTAAIVFADLSGYTALTERDERAALTLAALFHHAGSQRAAARNGRLVKTIGDAVLLRFEDVDSAVAATNELIASYTAAASALELAPLPIHAAVHYGEIVDAPNGDVFGATVNLAARLLGAAHPGQLVASESAFQAITRPVPASALGPRQFKNVEAAVSCYLLGQG
jgi:class 3 adenylate cyclase